MSKKSIKQIYIKKILIKKLIIRRSKNADLHNLENVDIFEGCIRFFPWNNLSYYKDKILIL